MRSVRRAGIGVMALLIAASVAGCTAENAGAPGTSTQSKVATPVPVAAPSTPAVPSAVPTGLSIPALGLTTAVHEMKASECPVLNPPPVDEAYWVGCRAKPGTDSDGTIFIIGHAVAGGEAVFKDLQHLAVDSDVLVTTPAGKLTYRVERTVVYAKSGEIQDSPEVMSESRDAWCSSPACSARAERRPTKPFVAQAELLSASTHG